MAYAFSSGTLSAASTLTNLVVAAGQNLIIIAGDESGQSKTLTISGGGNVYTSRGTVNDTFNGCTRTLIDCLSPAAGTYTLTLAGATSPGILALLYSGLSSFDAGSFRSSFNQEPATTTDLCATTSVTPGTFPSGLICGAFASGGVGASLTAGTGFTSRFANTTGLTFGDGAFSEDIRLTSGSHIASYTCSSGGTGSGVALVAGVYIELVDVLNSQVSL